MPATCDSMNGVTGTDLVADAVAELYSAAPAEFISRRKDCAASARAAGDAGAARKIAALRKPTQSAWVVNQLARAVPGAAEQLGQLGDDLRQAQQSGDGELIRQLSQQRRQLVDELVRQALGASGLRSAPAGVRDEVSATLSAAVADPQVAQRLAAGALDRAVRREGFGPAGVPTLVHPQPATTRPAPRTGRGTRTGPDRTAAADQPSRAQSAKTAARTGRAGAERTQAERAAADAQQAEAERAEAERAEAEHAAAEQRRREALASAEREAAQAAEAADAATAAENEQEEAVRLLEEQLAHAREQLSGTRAQARRLRAAQRRAQHGLERLRR